MPCKSDYLEPNSREEELQRAAQLLVFVLRRTGKNPARWMLREAKNIYASDERCVTELCATLKAMDPKERDALVYDARNKTSRDLANWWEDHQQADAKREKEEKAERKRNQAKSQALAKLTPEERTALGL